MTDNEKRAHDIAVAIMLKNVQPLTRADNLEDYQAKQFDFYNSIYKDMKIRLDDLSE